MSAIVNLLEEAFHVFLKLNFDISSTCPPSNNVMTKLTIFSPLLSFQDLVKSHLMFAVREEVEVLKEKISELMDRINQLEYENNILKQNASQETLSQLTPSGTPSAAQSAQTTAGAAAASVAAALTPLAKSQAAAAAAAASASSAAAAAGTPTVNPNANGSVS